MIDNPCHLYKGLKSGVGHAQKKKDRSHCVPFPKNAGWHWGWMGDDELIKTKAWSCIESQNRNISIPKTAIPVSLLICYEAIIHLR